MRQVAEQHGGSASVTNAVDGGAIFTLHLPGAPGRDRGESHGARAAPTGPVQFRRADRSLAGARVCIRATRAWRAIRNRLRSHQNSPANTGTTTSTSNARWLGLKASTIPTSSATDGIAASSDAWRAVAAEVLAAR